jgi:integrase
VATGAVYKRCACTEPAPTRTATAGGADGRPRPRQLGAACPQLRRPNGAWNPRHGTWYYTLELQAIPGDRRRQVKHGGYATQAAAEQALDAVRRLVAVADEADLPGTTRAQIVSLVQTANRTGEPLPTPEDLRRRCLAGHQPSRHLTLGEWLTEWFAAKGDIRRSTCRSYEVHLRLYLIPHLGHVRLDRLRAGHLTAMFAAIQADNIQIDAERAARQAAVTNLAAARAARDRAAIAAARARVLSAPPARRPVMAATQQRIRATLRSALSDAAAHGLITVNVAKLVKLTAPHRPRGLIWTDERLARWRDTGQVPSPVMVWTPAQTETFLTRTSGNPLHVMFHLIAMTGLRRGEACGLRWIDLDLHPATGDQPARGFMTVAQQIVQLGWETETGTPKSHSGERLVALAPVTVNALIKHRRTQRRQQLSAGGDCVDTGRVFTTETGAALHPADVTDTFKELITLTGLPPIRLHDLRHGTATHALAAGIDIKVVQEILGHSSSVITRDTYTAVLDDAKHAAAAAIADQLHQRRGRPVR